MHLVQVNELCQPEADLEDPIQAPGLGEAQLFRAEGEEEAASPSSSSSSPSSSSCSFLFLGAREEVSAAAAPSPPPQSPQGVRPSSQAMAATPWSPTEDSGLSSQGEEGPSTWHDQEDAESFLPEAPRLKMADLVRFLLLKYRTKEPTTMAEMLTMVRKEQWDHFPVVFSQASKCVQLVFGVDVKEVDPREHTYVLVPTLGLTHDGMLSDGQSFPKTGLLVLLLGLIVLDGDRTPEEEVWGALSNMGVYAGKAHCIYGEPRELLTKVWVQEGYLEYRQVPHSDLACYEFLWGPRAHTETSREQVQEYLLKVNSLDPRSFLFRSAEAVSDEEEEA